MRKLIATSLSVFLVTVAAGCGGDDASGSTTKKAVLEQFITEAEKEGATVDRDCAEDAISELSDSDASAILAAGINGDPDVSDEATAVAGNLIACIDEFGGILDTALDGSLPDVTIPDVSIPEGIEVTDAMIDAIVTSIEQSGASVDRDCIEDAIAGMNLDELAGQAGTMSPEFIQRFIGCVTP